MKKTYHGSCHCQAIKFEADLDLQVASKRCNCSFCKKSRYWKAFAYKGEFRLLEGEAALRDYQAADSSWPEGDVHHYFCAHCGIRCFSKGFLPMEPFNGEFHAIYVASLDDASDEELAQALVEYEDGRADHHERAPAIWQYL